MKGIFSHFHNKKCAYIMKRVCASKERTITVSIELNKQTMCQVQSNRYRHASTCSKCQNARATNVSKCQNAKAILHVLQPQTTRYKQKTVPYPIENCDGKHPKPYDTFTRQYTKSRDRTIKLAMCAGSSWRLKSMNFSDALTALYRTKRKANVWCAKYNNREYVRSQKVAGCCQASPEDHRHPQKVYFADSLNRTFSHLNYQTLERKNALMRVPHKYTVAVPILQSKMTNFCDSQLKHRDYTIIVILILIIVLEHAKEYTERHTR